MGPAKKMLFSYPENIGYVSRFLVDEIPEINLK
jgi:hypothetical protein